jgi:hypothetical protein
MKKKIAIFIVLAFTLVAFSSGASALSRRTYAELAALNPNEIQACFIFYDEQGVYFRTTTSGNQYHRFTGKITTDGNFVDVHGAALEWRDRFRMHSYDGTAYDGITYAFDTADIDGLDIKINGGNWVDFELYVDGRPMDTSQIYVGDSGSHPNSHAVRVML